MERRFDSSNPRDVKNWHLCFSYLDLENLISVQLHGLQSPVWMQKSFKRECAVGADKGSFEMFLTNWALHHDMYCDEKYLHARHLQHFSQGWKTALLIKTGVHH